MRKLLKPIACLAIAAAVFSSCKKKSSTEDEASLEIINALHEYAEHIVPM